VGVLLAGGLLAGPWSAGAMAAQSVSITLSQPTILADGVSTTKVTVGASATCRVLTMRRATVWGLPLRAGRYKATGSM
jgi:hypothetical protein